MSGWVHPRAMAGVRLSRRRRGLALERAWEVISRAGREIHIARLGSGTSLRDAAASVGIDYRTFARIERGDVAGVSVERLCLASAAVGLEFNGRPYLAGDAVRDAASLRLLSRLRACLPDDAPWQQEVPLPIPGDLRAIDAETRLVGTSIGYEAETRLTDIQAVARRALLKQRDAGLDVMVLVLNDTRGNRAVLAAHRDALRGHFPLDTRAVLRELRAGRPPGANGIVVL
jgi:transcriptional regulator with XRE-family HTH domain